MKKNNLNIKECIIDDRILNLLSNNFKFNYDFMHINKKLLGLKAIILEKNNIPVSFAILDYSTNISDLLREEIFYRFEDKIEIINETKDKNFKLKEIEFLKSNKRDFKNNIFYYIVFIESNKSQKGYATYLVEHIKKTYKKIVVLPVTENSEKLFKNCSFVDINGFSFSNI